MRSHVVPYSTATTFARLLRRAFLGFVLGGLAILIAYGAYSWHREEQGVRENLLLFSGYLASATQAYFDNLGNSLEPLGQLLDEVDVLHHPEAARDALLRYQKRYPEIAAMVVFSVDGDMLINTAVAAGRPLPNFSLDPPYWREMQAALAAPDLYTIGRPEVGKVLKQWRFPFRHVVRDTRGRARFLLQASIPLEQDNPFFQRLPVPAASYIGLLRSDLYQQARWPAQNPSKIYGVLSQGPAAQMVKSNPGIRTGYFRGVSPWSSDDGQRIGAFTRLSGQAMYAYISVPATHIMMLWWQHNAAVLGSFCLFFAIFGSISYRVTVRERSHSMELLDQARRDALTGLPNRAGIEDLLNATVSLARLSGQKCAILFLDLDRFKNINDSLGHDIGDQLLQAAAAVVKGGLRSGAIVGRLGGDEFLILLPGGDRTAAAVATERLMNAFGAPIQIGEHSLQITASIGIAIFPEHGDDIPTLLKHADTAMYEAKRLGRNAYAFYVESLGTQVRDRLALEHRLREALYSEGFALMYQPIIDVPSGRMVGVEALLRWPAADGSLTSPGDFIHIAEDSGLIIPIGEWVLRTACTQVTCWLAEGHDLWVAVNLSVRQFQDPLLLTKIQSALHDTGLDADRLELEITESAAMLDPESSVTVLSQIKAMGVHIAIDDFGTGYSSLSYLKRIPADTIKIDKSFIDGLGIDAEDTAIVHTVIALATTLEKHTTAEGIETAAQFAAIRELGCQSAQGYWLGRPATPAEIAAAHKSGSAVAASFRLSTSA